MLDNEAACWVSRHVLQDILGYRKTPANWNGNERKDKLNANNKSTNSWNKQCEGTQGNRNEWMTDWMSEWMNDWMSEWMAEKKPTEMRSCTQYQRIIEPNRILSARLPDDDGSDLWDRIRDLSEYVLYCIAPREAVCNKDRDAGRSVSVCQEKKGREAG